MGFRVPRLGLGGRILGIFNRDHKSLWENRLHEENVYPFAGVIHDCQYSPDSFQLSRVGVSIIGINSGFDDGLIWVNLSPGMMTKDWTPGEIKERSVCGYYQKDTDTFHLVDWWNMSVGITLMDIFDHIKKVQRSRADNCYDEVL